MFASARRQALDSCRWKAKGGYVEYVEALRYQSDREANEENFHYGSLKGNEIVEWVKKPASPTRPDNSKLLGKIRLLICERERYELDIPVAREIFEDVEREFHLAPATLPSFQNEAGTFSRFLTYSDKDATKIERIACVIKAPQKREICNWGLSLSYELASGITSAMLYGRSVLRTRKTDLIETGYTRSIHAFLDTIREAIDAWTHPLLLPCILLGEHMDRIKAFCDHGTAMKETVDIEWKLGVTKVGQSNYIIPDDNATGELHFRVDPDKYPTPQEYSTSPKLQRHETEELRVRINTHSTRMLFTSRSPQWNMACSNFIQKLLDELEPHPPGRTKAHHMLEEQLEYNLALAESASSNIATVQERIALQLQVLYNFVAEMDNQLSAELAAAAGRDSTSMKILAFISALFLPGSFVAGIFSMSVFDWQAGEGGSDNSDGELASSRFWIYWAVAVPLTIITILGWAAWWRFELERFNRKMNHAARNTPIQGEKNIQDHDSNQEKAGEVRLREVVVDEGPNRASR